MHVTAWRNARATSRPGHAIPVQQRRIIACRYRFPFTGLKIYLWNITTSLFSECLPERLQTHRSTEPWVASVFPTLNPDVFQTSSKLWVCGWFPKVWPFKRKFYQQNVPLVPFVFYFVHVLKLLDNCPKLEHSVVRLVLWRPQGCAWQKTKGQYMTIALFNVKYRKGFYIERLMAKTAFFC